MDDPIASQEQKDEGLEGGEISPERTPSDDVVLSALVTPGSESSSKRRKKHGTSKRRGKKIIATEEEPEVAPVAPPSPSSLMLLKRNRKLHQLCGYRPLLFILKLVSAIQLNKMILYLYRLLFEFENAFIIHFCTSLFI